MVLNNQKNIQMIYNQYIIDENYYFQFNMERFAMVFSINLNKEEWSCCGDLARQVRS